MTLDTFLPTRIPASPDDADSPPLFVFRGVLTDADEQRVMHEAYKGYPYAYLLRVPDAKMVRYEGGSARWLAPVDVVLEQREPYSLAVMTAVYNTIYNTVPKFVDELEPGVPLAGRFQYIGGMRPESLRKNFLEATLRFDSNWLA